MSKKKQEVIPEVILDMSKARVAEQQVEAMASTGMKSEKLKRKRERFNEILEGLKQGKSFEEICTKEELDAIKDEEKTMEKG